MHLQERCQLEGELTALERMIETTPEELWFERIGFEHRKKEIEKVLADYPESLQEPARASITFRGCPVIGTQGIFAQFAAEALGAFADAVATVGASMSNDLGSRGKIPERNKFSFLITGTSLGSFGFQLEEAPAQDTIQQPLFEEDSPAKLALRQTCDFLRATLGSDDQLADAVLETDARAIESMRKFLFLLASNEASCTLSFERASGFSFDEVSEVQQSLERIRQDNLFEEEVELEGFFEGVLPKKREFQFKEENNNDSIIGKIENTIENASVINDSLGKKVRLSLVKKTVGNGKPRYRLKSYTIEATNK